MQTTLLETMAEHDLKTTITFHHRIVEAQGFAEGLDRVAARLRAVDPVRHPATVWAGWLRGEHEAEHRAAVLADFGRRAGRAVFANCRVLGEGVDIRAVDSVALIDPRGSAVDIVQAIGRALRQKPGGGKGHLNRARILAGGRESRGHSHLEIVWPPYSGFEWASGAR
ncbi:helicase-related protein [Streptomyces sp. NPDC059104]|uniref:helicase-related protein n=1 Tax=Streptomyces sp. NPDC059104 TaxID=3346729 RepID=UPI0036AC20C8